MHALSLRNRPATGMPLVAAVALLVSLALPGVGRAEIYGWVDGNGVVTYSNLPPPAGVTVTDRIAESTPSPQAAAELNRRVEVAALNDRIRLLELEMARAKREVVDYPTPPVAPNASGCGPDGTYDCGPQWGAYYPGAVLYGVGLRGRRSYHGPYAHPYPVRHAAPGASSLARVAGPSAAGGRSHR